jgi:cysteine-rich repeat protein
MNRKTASQDVRLYSASLTTTCGNGLVGFGEECGDNGGVDGDGCSSACKVEDGYVSSGAPSIWIQPP